MDRPRDSPDGEEALQPTVEDLRRLLFGPADVSVINMVRDLYGSGLVQASQLVRRWAAAYETRGVRYLTLSVRECGTHSPSASLPFQTEQAYLARLSSVCTNVT